MNGDVTAALVGQGWVVETMDSSRVVVSNSFRSSRSPGLPTIEVRQASDPTSTLYRRTDAWATGGFACMQLVGDWLVRTDTHRVPSRLIPGPPEPWALLATNMRTGRRVELDHGKTDMSSEYACPVANGTRLAWTSGQARSTTVFDLATGVTSRVSASGDPVGWNGDSILLARYTKRRVHVVRAGAGSTAPPLPVLTATAEQLRAVAGRLVWWGRRNPNSENFRTRIYTCLVSNCRAGDLPSHQLTVSANELGWVAVSSTLMAWSGEGPHAQALTIRRLDTGQSVPNEIKGEVWPLAAAGNTVAFVTTPLGKVAPFTLHVLRVT